MANIITISRFPLLFIYVALLYSGNETILWWCVPLIIFIILLDTADGIVARKLGQTSLLGSALDIAADRIVEMILWVVFAHQNLISILVPLIVIFRDISVDTVRSVGVSQGMPPFKQVNNPLSRFLVASPLMRSSYAVAKILAFVSLTATLAIQTANSSAAFTMQTVSTILTWIAVIMCVLRGIPVLVEGYQTFRKSESTS